MQFTLFLVCMALLACSMFVSVGSVPTSNINRRLQDRSLNTRAKGPAAAPAPSPQPAKPSKPNGSSSSSGKGAAPGEKGAPIQLLSTDETLNSRAKGPAAAAASSAPKPAKPSKPNGSSSSSGKGAAPGEKGGPLQGLSIVDERA